jgi:hypothetical protein
MFYFLYVTGNLVLSAETSSAVVEDPAGRRHTLRLCLSTVSSPCRSEQATDPFGAYFDA